MLIEQEVSGDIEELTTLFKHSPQKTELAIQRTMRKLSTWVERQVLRELASQLKITQKLFKEFGRVKTTLSRPKSDSQYLIVWIGTFPVGAHKFGKARQTPRGVQVGRHSFWQSAFLMQPVNSPREFVFNRKKEWAHRYQQSQRSGRWMWMGLPIEKKSVKIFSEAEAALNTMQPKIFERFSTLLHQELNYAFNVEPRKSGN